MRSNIHYGWFILLLAFFALLSVQGVRLSFGAFMQPWEATFGVDRGTISAIAMVSFFVFGISQPIYGKILARFGMRHIFAGSALLIGLSLIGVRYATELWQVMVLYGIIASIGFGGASNVTASLAVTNWFVKRRGFAFGLMSSGSSFGQLLVVPASLWLITLVGWEMTSWIFGLAITLVIAPLLYLFLRNNPQDVGLAPYGADPAANETAATVHVETAPVTLRVLLDRRFLFLALPFFVCGYTTTGLIDTHLIPYAHEHGFSTQTTGTAFSLLAAFNIAGTLLSGQLADKWNNRAFLAGLYIMRALTVILLTMTDQIALLYLFAALFGLVDFATIAPTMMLATNYFKRFAVGIVIGWIYLLHQLGSAAGAYVTGWLYDVSGQYETGMIIGVALLIVASALCLMLPKPQTETASP